MWLASLPPFNTNQPYPRIAKNDATKILAKYEYIYLCQMQKKGATKFLAKVWVYIIVFQMQQKRGQCNKNFGKILECISHYVKCNKKGGNEIFGKIYECTYLCQMQQKRGQQIFWQKYECVSLFFKCSKKVGNATKILAD